MLYLLNKTDQFIEADEPMKVNVGSDQIVKENKDVVRLLSLLADTTVQLAKVKAREVLAQPDKKRRSITSWLCKPN
ncbi:hypothetical protein H4J46_07455 [Colwellia sp. MB02u-6]|jgi:hypothetical protein|uniref:hypothetical protein n=1 Tax=Colwellia sp. MB02u-6 TaxID=2759824 RepID=UPI0015F4C1BE|nr:hypothetical protein [Colwellia sp. MB02u-6]MBA6327771.1 hypothetical protein [Colwellia sp. MB02u-6]